MSHSNWKGKFDLNYEKDTFNLKEITTLFRGKYSQGSVEGLSPAEALRGQPKLFFVQKLPSMVQSDATGSEADEYLPHHPDADVMITFSEGGFKDKTKEKGISAFYDALLRCVRNDQNPDYYDLFKILTKVRREMTDQKHPVPWTQTQLRSEVLFSK
uniref:Caspase-7 n=1 Tax=Phallusia mammillata TaxID=59560 RepID=A0A6F9D7S5_9ASCI|nr:caspase-7 [Phallusia mammillata]